MDEPFHHQQRGLPDGNTSALCKLSVASWNLGGLTPQKILQVLLPALRGQPPLDTVDIWLFQEVIAPEGTGFDSDQQWRIVTGRTKYDWKGLAIAFRTHLGTHAHTQTSRAGLSTCLKPARGHRMGLVNYHLPHHATIDQARAQLSDLGDHKATRSRIVALGMDANETFRARGHQPLAITGRGEALLQWLAEQRLRMPPQDLERPTHFPYNTA